MSHNWKKGDIARCVVSSNLSNIAYPGQEGELFRVKEVSNGALVMEGPGGRTYPLDPRRFVYHPEDQDKIPTNLPLTVEDENHGESPDTKYADVQHDLKIPIGSDEIDPAVLVHVAMNMIPVGARITHVKFMASEKELFVRYIKDIRVKGD